jgi:outer membrane immunogenic protein
MTRLVFVSASLVALAVGTAAAADYPIGPAIGPQYAVNPAYVITPGFSWNGFYVGGNVGGHFGSDQITPTADASGGFGPAGAAAINAMSPTTLHPEGVIGGIQGGYNWQIGNVLYGLEVDASAVGGTAQRTLSGFGPAIAPGDFMTNSTGATALATVRPRLGWAWDRNLFYITGGYAFGNVRVTDTFSFFSGSFVGAFNTSARQSGWTVGAGYEYAFVNAWSVKVEYLFVDLGGFPNLIPGPLAGAPANIRVQHDYTDNIARVGVNYHFGY